MNKKQPTTPQEGEVVVTKNESGQIVAVTRQDEDGHILSVIAESAPAGEPVAWLVCSVNTDGSLSLEHAAAWEQAAHEHINDAITEHDIDGAASWIVRPAYTTPQPRKLTDEQWQVIADTLGCFITRSQKDIIEAAIGGQS